MESIKNNWMVQHSQLLTTSWSSPKQQLARIFDLCFINDFSKGGLQPPQPPCGCSTVTTFQLREVPLSLVCWRPWVFKITFFMNFANSKKRLQINAIPFFLFFFKKATEEILILRNSNPPKSFPHSKFNPLDEVGQIWKKLFCVVESLYGAFQRTGLTFLKTPSFFILLDFLKKLIWQIWLVYSVLLKIEP